MRVKVLWRTLTLLFPVLLWAVPVQHTVTARLDYNFKRHHGCKPKETHPCVVQFNIYDLKRSDKPVKLFSIPAPAGAKKQVKGITGDSGPVALDPGAHTFGATAQLADGQESDPWLCTAGAVVGTDSHISLNMR